MDFQLVVTGRGVDGKSIVMDKIDTPVTSTFDHAPGLSVSRIWSTAINPVLGAAAPVAIPLPDSFVPAAGETRFTQIVFPPDAVWEEIKDWEALGKEYAEKLPGLADTFEPDSPGMHTTKTVDYIILAAGELWLELDDGVQRHLRTGDVVIQNGTRHAWRNLSRQPAVMFSVMVGAITEADS